MEAELWHQILTGTVVVLVFVSFVREWFPPDQTAMGAFILLALAGVLAPDTSLLVFGSQAPVTVAAMFIMSAALDRTGVIEALAGAFERLAGSRGPRVLVVLMLVVAVLSAFVNNTPVVVVFLPIVLRHCRKFQLPASRFLIPLSYAAIVGGTCTVIGTSTNLIAAGIAADSGMAPFSMFEISKLGLLFVVCTLVYMVAGGQRLIPLRDTLSTLIDSEASREFLTQAWITQNSPLVGKPFSETPLARRRELRVIEVVRQGRPVPIPLNRLVFEADDQILFKTRASGVMELNDTEGLNLLKEDDLGLDRVRTESALLMEGIVGPESRMVGRSLTDLNFRQRFGVLILAVHRRGVNLRDRFENVKLAFGDSLLIEGPADRVNDLFSQKDFVNLSRAKERPLRRTKGPIVLAALLAFMVGGALFPGHIPILAIGAVLVTLMTRCLDATEAYEAVEWKVIFMIFGMLGLGMALQETGLASMLAAQAVAWFGDYSPQVMLGVIYLMAVILTEMVSNNAVAALLTPIAIGVAAHMGVDARPFVVAVMFASSASFVTPIGYQTNTYVFGAGGYRFSDFFRVGFPLACLLGILAWWLIPMMWPF